MSLSVKLVVGVNDVDFAQLKLKRHVDPEKHMLSDSPMHPSCTVYCRWCRLSRFPFPEQKQPSSNSRQTRVSRHINVLKVKVT